MSRPTSLSCHLAPKETNYHYKYFCGGSLNIIVKKKKIINGLHYENNALKYFTNVHTHATMTPKP